ncbi:MAG TPA: SOS response-associated peptidase family protein [Bacillota bacterium]|nr:SOS response-associated peptidase family protein [Bacillota bacterium]
MCCRFYIAPSDASPEMLKHLDDLERRCPDAGLIEYGDIFPKQYAPVFSRGKDSTVRLYPMQWGFSLAGKCVANARSETASVKPLFADSFARRRCIIPAQSYYEWKTNGSEKTLWRFSGKAGKTLYMAGLYKYEQGKNAPVFTVMTRCAYGTYAAVHERMPLLLSRDSAMAFLVSGDGIPDAREECLTLAKVE